MCILGRESPMSDVRVLMYVNPIFWAAVCGAWGKCSRYMGRNSNMHRVEVHGAAMYNEWTAEPLEDEEKWMIFFFPDISHASVSCIFYWPCLLGLLLAWGARQMLHVPPLSVCVYECDTNKASKPCMCAPGCEVQDWFKVSLQRWMKCSMLLKQEVLISHWRFRLNRSFRPHPHWWVFNLTQRFITKVVSFQLSVSDLCQT